MNRQLVSRFTLALAGACVVFGLLALLFWLGVGRGYSWLPPDASRAPRLPTVDSLKTEDFSLPPLADFAEVTQRPLFSEDRKPIAPDQTAEQAPDKAAPPPVPLQVVLTGVIITPDLRLAMVLNKATNKPESLQVGMPLSGNQSGWTLVEIQPRKVTFSNGDEKTEVTLDVSAKSGNPAVQRAAQRAARAKATPARAQSKNAANALRERIEKRRRELRQQARKARQKAKNDKNDKQQSPAWLPQSKSGS
ncbi:MAG TPA: hypothetical protein VFG73_09890 [Rhodanobacteraceae bacterium]|nr:hypothetical protein [Rhodanobacteraceae bacterium]